MDERDLRNGGGGEETAAVAAAMAATESSEYSVSLYGLWLRHFMAISFSCLIFFLIKLAQYICSLQSNNKFAI